jgi:hypothetical protein
VSTWKVSRNRKDMTKVIIRGALEIKKRPQSHTNRPNWQNSSYKIEASPIKSILQLNTKLKQLLKSLDLISSIHNSY